jgi:oxygen-independent coproporphyrinogen-3 oxidase
LAVLGRSHDPECAIAGLERARTLGTFSVSADAIVGIPGQTEATLGRSLTALGESAEHISVYILSIEPGTELERRVRRGDVELPGDDEVMALYRHACRLLAGMGLEHYEISNWCRPGHDCIHNQIYWKRGDYVGLGAGAHSHRDGVRYARLRRPAAYIDAVMCGTTPIGMREVLTRAQILLEEVMLGLRTSEGIDLEDMASRYGNGIDRMNGILDDLAASGLIVKVQSNVLLSPRGIAVHDSISEALASALSS